MVRRSGRPSSRTSFYSPYSKKGRSWKYYDKPTYYQPRPLGVELPFGTLRVEGVKLDTSSLASMTVVDDSISEELMQDVPDQPIEELRSPLRWNGYQCGCYSEENDLFPRPMHRLKCCLFDWERNKTGKRLVASFNQGLLKLSYDHAADIDEYEAMEDDGLLVPLLFVSITKNLHVIDSFHLPCIVKGVGKLMKKVKNLQQRMDEQWNATGGVATGVQKLRKQYLDQFVHLAAMCFHVARHLLLMAKDNVNENKGPLFQKQFEGFLEEEDWKDYVNIPPYKTHEKEPGSGRYRCHTDKEGLKLLEYLDEVLLDRACSSMRDVATDFSGVPAKVNGMNMREVCDLGEEELVEPTIQDFAAWDEDIGTNRRDTRRIRELTKSVFVEIAVDMFVAGITLYMLSDSERKMCVGLEFVFGDHTYLAKEPNDDVCTGCGNLKREARALGVPDE
jgi:hypothetical protein